MWQKFSHLISPFLQSHIRIKKGRKSFLKYGHDQALPNCSAFLYCKTSASLTHSYVTISFLSLSLTTKTVNNYTKWLLLILLELLHYTAASLKSSRISPGDPLQSPHMLQPLQLFFLPLRWKADVPAKGSLYLCPVAPEDLFWSCL